MTLLGESATPVLDRLEVALGQIAEALTTRRPEAARLSPQDRDEAQDLVRGAQLSSSGTAPRT